MRIKTIQAATSDDEHQFYILLVDCGGGSTVKTYIRDQYQGLVREGYESIIGLYDVHPNKLSDLHQVRLYAPRLVPTKPIPTKIILAVMEVEAWFIAEYTHFQRIDNRMTLDAVTNAIGFDPSVADVELCPHPAGAMDLAYQIAGLRYAKSQSLLSKTVSTLAYDDLYLVHADRVPSLRELVTAINDFLTPSAPLAAGRACDDS